MSSNSFSQIYNTTFSGQSSSLSGEDVRNLEFSAALAMPSAVVLATGASLSADDLVQASIGSLLLAPDDDALGHVLDVGFDTLAHAQSLLNFFQLTALGQERLLRFCLSGTGLASDITLAASGGTSNNITISSGGIAPGASQVLFDVSVNQGTTGAAGNQAGLERLVVVSPVSLTSTGAKIDFNILAGSR